MVFYFILFCFLSWSENQFIIKRKKNLIYLIFRLTFIVIIWFIESILARCCRGTSLVHQWFNKCQGNDVIVES